MRVVVTGAFSYTGAAVARELLDRGHSVHTLTNRRPPAETHGITQAPLLFDTTAIARQLEGADVLVNTFWIRLPYAGQTFETAVRDSQCFIDAAKRTGTRLVHVSVSNAAAGKNLGYYRGKAEVEEALRRSGNSYAIVRPTLVVGDNDVLSNNIAWFLRHFPLFPLPNGGRYRLQPITLHDTARIICDAVLRRDDFEVDAAGPEIMSFATYVRLLARACRIHRLIVPVPASLALFGLKLVEPLLHDVVLTREELLGLEQELLVSKAPPLGKESVPQYLMSHGEELGRHYVNDLTRHFRGGKHEALVGSSPVARVQ